MLLVTSDNRLDHFLVEAKNQQPSINHVGHCSMCTKFHVLSPWFSNQKQGMKTAPPGSRLWCTGPNGKFCVPTKGDWNGWSNPLRWNMWKHEVPLVAASNEQFILQHRRPKQGITEVPDWKVSDFPMGTTLCTKLHQLLRITSSRPQGTANLRWRVAVV